MMNEKVLQFRIKLIPFILSINVGDLLIFFFSRFSLPKKFPQQISFLFCRLFSCFIRLVCKRKNHKLPELMLCGRRYYMISLFCVLNVITHIHVTLCEWIQQLIFLTHD